MKKKFTEKGFTLIELILYVSMAAILLSVTSTLFITVISNQAKYEAVRRVEDAGSQIMRILTESIKNADSIDGPLPGESAGILSIHSKDSSRDPTTITLLDGTINMEEGLNPVNVLSSPEVKITDLLFKNLGGTTTSGSIRVEFMASARNQGGRNELNYSDTFYGTANPR
jgi:type II secretory pathway pseudopilin PulG